jgi:hypothetical protein
MTPDAGDLATQHRAPSVNTALRIPTEQMGRIEKFRNSLVIKPSLSEAIRFLIEAGLERRVDAAADGREAQVNQC